MFSAKNLEMLVSLVLIVAAVNWGAVAYFETDLVKTVIPHAGAEKVVKVLVGLVGLYALYDLFA